MEALSINLEAYPIDGATSPEGEPISFDVRQGIYDVLLNPLLGLTAKQIIEHGPLARRILACVDPVLTLDRKDYDILLWSFEQIGGGGPGGVRKPGFMAAAEEMVRRVLNAPKIQVDAVPSDADSAE